MNADDDGFCEHFTVMRMIDAKPDDLKILHAKGFVKIFDDRVLVIIDWKENNYLRNDRYSPSKYLEIYKEELKQLSYGIPNGYQVDTQVRLGKVRLGKVKEPTVPATPSPFILKDEIQKLKDSPQRHIQLIGEYLEEKKIKLENKAQLDRAKDRHMRAARALADFSDKQIADASDQAAKEYPAWTLETVVKILTR
jgi:hypothetical protein